MALFDGKRKEGADNLMEAVFFLMNERTYVRRSEHEIKRNAEIGLFTLPLIIRKHWLTLI